MENVQRLTTKQKGIVFVVSAAIYFIAASVFNYLFTVDATVFTPEIALGPVLGLLFGWPAILGTAVGSFVADFVFCRSIGYALVCIPINILFSFILFKLWIQSSEKEDFLFRIDSIRRVIRFILVALCASVVGGALFGIAKSVFLDAPMSQSIARSFYYCFNRIAVWGIPLIVVLDFVSDRVQSGAPRFRNKSMVEKTVLYSFLVNIIFIAVTTIIVFGASHLRGDVSAWNEIHTFLSIVELIISLGGPGVISAASGKERSARRFYIISCIAVFILCGVSIVKTYKLELLSYSSDIAATFGLNVAAMLFAATLYLICVCDKHPVSKQSTWYMLLLLINVLLCIVNCGLWVLFGKPESEDLLVGLNTLYYEMGIFSFIFTFQFFKAGLNITKHQYKVGSSIVYLVSTITSALILSTPWTKIMYAPTGTGDLEYYSWSYAESYCLIIMGLIVLYMLIKEKAQLSEKLAIAALVILPVVGGYVTFGHSFFYISSALNICAITLSFGLIYTKRSNELGEKQKDLEMAAAVQTSRLPKNFDIGSREVFDIYASMKFAKEIGGDFYDFFELGDKELGFGVADVSGKGSSAAFFMMRAFTTIRNFATSETSLKTVMEKSNTSLHEDNEALLFLTAWYAKLNYENGIVTYVNAGHNLPYIIHQDGSIEQLACKADTMMAFFPGMEYTEQEFKMQKGDILFLYTDGIPDAQSDYEARFGEERLVDSLKKYSQGADCKAICEGVQKDVEDFMGHADQFDDITMLALKYNK